MIWQTPFTIEAINDNSRNSMSEYLGIQFTAFGDDFLEATMPANERTVQPYRIMHGGANVVLAETLGSVASILCIKDPMQYVPVGLEINANHLSSVPEGSVVTGTVKPIRIGRSVHVWNIEIKDATGKLTCVSRLTVSIVPRR